MTFFLFAGDMLVMLFMVVLVIWVSLRSSKTELDQAARIPLEDEKRDE
jgi:cbb3-type cytochrome oxidase subunit 3